MFIQRNARQRRAEFQPPEPSRERRLLARYQQLRSQPAARSRRMHKECPYARRVHSGIEERIILSFDVVATK